MAVMLGLTGGEWFVVVFLTVAVLVAPWALRLGAALGRRFESRSDRGTEG